MSERKCSPVDSKWKWSFIKIILFLYIPTFHRTIFLLCKCNIFWYSILKYLIFNVPQYIFLFPRHLLVCGCRDVNERVDFFSRDTEKTLGTSNRSEAQHSILISVCPTFILSHPACESNGEYVHTRRKKIFRRFLSRPRATGLRSVFYALHIFVHQKESCSPGKKLSLFLLSSVYSFIYCFPCPYNPSSVKYRNWALTYQSEKIQPGERLLCHIENILGHLLKRISVHNFFPLVLFLLCGTCGGVEGYIWQEDHGDLVKKGIINIIINDTQHRILCKSTHVGCTKENNEDDMC